MTEHPDCSRCGQPFARHQEIVGSGRICPVSAMSYRPTPSSEANARVVWEMLKARCASDPERARRVVMVSEADVLYAVRGAGL